MMLISPSIANDRLAFYANPPEVAALAAHQLHKEVL
jgi:hypothetical protein